VKLLVEKKIVDNGDYWLTNAQKGSQCEGKRVGEMLIRMAGTFEPVKDRNEAIKVLAAKKVISSPVFWEERAIDGRTCSGDNVRAVIRNFARLAAEKEPRTK
jgi:hypothetical protein